MLKLIDAFEFQDIPVKLAALRPQVATQSHALPPPPQHHTVPLKGNVSFRHTDAAKPPTTPTLAPAIDPVSALSYATCGTCCYRTLMVASCARLCRRLWVHCLSSLTQAACSTRSARVSAPNWTRRVNHHHRLHTRLSTSRSHQRAVGTSRSQETRHKRQSQQVHPSASVQQRQWQWYKGLH